MSCSGIADPEREFVAMSCAQLELSGLSRQLSLFMNKFGEVHATSKSKMNQRMT